VAERRAYFDTSTVLPLYRQEAHTAPAEALVDDWIPVISALCEVEVASAVAHWVRLGELTEDLAASVDQAFVQDLKEGVFERVPVTDSNYWQAREWLGQRNTSLRSLDAIHLACAAENGLTLMTADKLFYDAARKLGQSALLLEL
jgi:predicted nucleic acid-binding protein